ncbi:hypothetical protein PP175_28010 (plasmid) [Aneurinibacillus sp. Ricciae_BoGa-3]|uniref:hypothetical protein n=1 Tax=Aneurinibacillus sp. Ricciae_BoGa-3 TaxID=3022697 RepID=UPI002341299B|nr:hypothetical protein [Aneurinibacillus sp. Ricciae_BoGa-3]WCK57037.1 hypothetical protein PP175_28010 [Aneurinibacillus sp. Ricciae_BoGa-3]
MDKEVAFSATVEIAVYYHDSDGRPDIHYEYAHDLTKLLVFCSKEYAESMKKQWKAQDVQVGKIELVSLSLDNDVPIRDNRYSIEIGQNGITMKNSMEKE